MSLNSSPISRGRASYADYQQWPQEERLEIIDGVPYAMNAPLRIHQEILMELSRQFANHFKESFCRVYAAPFDVRFPEKSKKDEEIFNVVQPDLSLICDESKLDDRGCLGSPDLIVEVLSPSSSSIDNIKKRALYERCGVKEFWLVHPSDKIVTIYRLMNRFYGKPEIYDNQETVSPGDFPDLKISLSELFKR